MNMRMRTFTQKENNFFGCGHRLAECIRDISMVFARRLCSQCLAEFAAVVRVWIKRNIGRSTHTHTGTMKTSAVQTKLCRIAYTERIDPGKCTNSTRTVQSGQRNSAIEEDSDKTATTPRSKCEEQIM